MKWYRNLYEGEMAAKSKYKIFGRVREERFCFDTYLITLPTNSDNLLDVIPVNVLKQPFFKKNKKNLFVVGIADGKDEAFEVVRDIIDDVYRQTGAFDVEGFLKRR